MSYYIRLFSKFSRHVPVEQIRATLAIDGLPSVNCQIEEGNSAEWSRLLIKNGRGENICVIQRNESGIDELFDEEVAEFNEMLEDCLPRSGADWVSSYLSRAECVYACEFLHATSLEGDSEEVAPHHILWAIKSNVGGIIQADDEGFSNEDGYMVTWQCDDSVCGPWNCAVLTNLEQWTAFEMDLGNRSQRAEFTEGKVPKGVKIIG